MIHEKQGNERKKESTTDRGRNVISNKLLTWSWDGRSSLFLYPKSPRALDTAKSPLTLFIITDPPAASILFFSLSLEGFMVTNQSESNGEIAIAM